MADDEWDDVDEYVIPRLSVRPAETGGIHLEYL